jgi:hypothetical protein
MMRDQEAMRIVAGFYNTQAAERPRRMKCQPSRRLVADIRHASLRNRPEQQIGPYSSAVECRIRMTRIAETLSNCISRCRKRLSRGRQHRDGSPRTADLRRVRASHARLASAGALPSEPKPG